MVDTELKLNNSNNKIDITNNGHYNKNKFCFLIISKVSKKGISGDRLDYYVTYS